METEKRYSFLYIYWIPSSSCISYLWELIMLGTEMRDNAG